MISSKLLLRLKNHFTNFVFVPIKISCVDDVIFIRKYSDKKDKKDDGCREAIADMPKKGDPECSLPCEGRRKKKQGILHKIKLKLVEGGTNFGTPFRRLECKNQEPPCIDKKVEDPKALPPPEKKKEKASPTPESRRGVQVALLGADTAVGQYISLLLKQCPCIKKLRLYEAKDTSCETCSREINKVVQDLQHIDTNCLVQAFSSQCGELDRCLQNTDIVLMLESAYTNPDMPLDKRFCCQAPMVKKYADAIGHECPRAMVIVCTTPIDCMVPLIAETLKETGWYDPRKLIGSLAVPEMRASTLAARALSLEPSYTKVPCVGGTEGESLVPLFSKAVEYFDFAEHNAELMTCAVRMASMAVSRAEDYCIKTAELSEAHAVARLVVKVAHALLCQDIPRVTGFVETDAGQVVSPANYLAVNVLLNRHGVCKKFDLPRNLNNFELNKLDIALYELQKNVAMSLNWYRKEADYEMEKGKMTMVKDFGLPKHYDHLEDCIAHVVP